MGNTLKFEKQGQVVEGELLEVRENVGPNESTVYVISTKNGVEQYWGANALDPSMTSVKIGEKVRITLTDLDFKFPNGRRGKNFKVEVDR